MTDAQIIAKAKAEAYEHAANRAMELAGELRHCLGDFGTYGWGFNIEMARNILYDGIMALIPAPAPAGEPQPEVAELVFDDAEHQQKNATVIRNLAMLVRRLAYRHTNRKLAEQAQNYLLGENLQGSILREPQPQAPSEPGGNS